MKLSLTTSYAENWRYNIMVTLSMRDSAGEQVGYRSVEDSPLPMGSDEASAPAGWVRRREVELEFGQCNSVRFYVYLLPTVLPETTTLASAKTSFPLKVEISEAGKTLFAEKIEVNCFGGCGKEFVVEL